MRKLGILIIVLIMITGCGRQDNEINKARNNSNEMHTLLTESDHFNQKVENLLEPLLEGIYLENKMIQGATYQEGMTLEDLREFMLKYYTEELVNETIELILYKSELGYGTEYSGMYYYDEETDIFYLSDSRSLEVLPENPKIEIVSITIQTEDRIELIVMTSWELLQNNKAISEKGKLKPNYLYITLEKEGDDWYLGDLVFSRTTINEANRVYRK